MKRKIRRTIPPKGADKYWNLYQYKDMLYYRAWQIHNRTGRDFNECLSDCYLIFCEACQTYDKTKSSFSTYLWLMITWKYKQVIKPLVKKGIMIPLDDIIPIPHSSNIEHDVIFKNEIENLPEEAKQIVDYCFDLYKNNKVEKLVKYKINSHFIKNKMPVYNTKTAINEIRTLLKGN